MIEVRAAERGDLPWIRELLDEHWGGEEQVVNGESYRPADLPGFVATIDGERVGYAALRVVGDVAPALPNRHDERQPRSEGTLPPARVRPRRSAGRGRHERAAHQTDDPARFRRRHADHRRVGVRATARRGGPGST